MIRLYLDTCSLNRPYDDQSFLKIRLEAETKTYIQQQILAAVYELAWSYILDYEISFNLYPARKTKITKWENVAVIDIDYSSANQLIQKSIKPKDALHITCALEGGCSHFITTDEKLLKKSVAGISMMNPLDFVRTIEAPT